MRTFLLILCASAALLNGCAPKPDESGSTTTTTTSTSTSVTTPGAPPGPGGEQGKVPESQRLFMASAEKLQKGDTKGCEELLNQAAAEALKEKDDVDYIHIKETQAKLRVQVNDKAGAKKILEEQLEKYEKSADPRVVSRLDGVKYLLAKLYAVEGQKDKADALFKNFETRMDKAAAEEEKKGEWANYLQAKEAQARLKADREDNAGAIKVLDTEIKKFSAKPGMAPEIQQRLELFKMLRISLLAKSGKAEEAQKEYLALIAAARKEKPVNHRKLAFALHEYAEFLRFTKRGDQATKFDTEAKAELEKK